MCGLPWPCAGPRTRTIRRAPACNADTGGGTRLAILMWSYLEDFALDRGPAPLTGAFERFIAWARPRLTPRTGIDPRS